MYKDLDTSIDANPEHVAIILQGVGTWNNWRENNPSITPNLRGIDFCNSDLIRTSSLWRQEVASETKPKINFVELSGANFSSCLLRGVSFENANIHNANFENAELIFVSFKNAEPWNCELTGADCGGADFSGADFGGVKYSRRKMRCNFLSVRGAEAIVGDAVFKRDVMDQEYLDTLDFRIKRDLRYKGIFANLRSGLLPSRRFLVFLLES